MRALAERSEQGEPTEDERLNLALLTARAAQERTRAADQKANTAMVILGGGFALTAVVSLVAAIPQAEE